MKTQQQILEYFKLKNHMHHKFTNIYIDSRLCDDSDVFIALKGQISDGNDFIDDVIKKGVKLVLTDTQEMANGIVIFFIENLRQELPLFAKWFYDNLDLEQNIIGITGTNGKTSISHYLSQINDLIGQKSLLCGTNGNGIYPDLKKTTHTTLDNLSLNRLFNQYGKDVQNIIMEVSSHSLEQDRVADVGFKTVIFSNLTHDHLDYHKTMQNYFESKLKLFKYSNLEKHIVNIDDNYGKKIVQYLLQNGVSSQKILQVSTKDKKADIYLEKITLKKTQTLFKLFFLQKFILEAETSLLGGFNLNNLALALANIIDKKIDVKKLSRFISLIKPVKGRMESITLKNGVNIVIDYAHTPDALENALISLQIYTKNKLKCMFGCGGNRDTSKRAKMAQIVEKYADDVVVTEDNSRFESFDKIINDMKSGFRGNTYQTIKSREMAIKHLIKTSQTGDVLLFAGKGHENYMDNIGKKTHFDEREIIKKYTK